MKSGFETIANDCLETVAGGTTPTFTTTTSSGSNNQLVTAVQGIQSSLKDLSANRNQGLFGGQNGMLTACVFAKLLSSRNSSTVVYSGRGGYYWQSSWS